MNSGMTSAQARKHVRRVVARSGSSFSAGMKVLPRKRRDAMYAVYAFCREIDDIADEGGSQAEKLAALEEWREELERLFEGHPTFPTAIALLDPVREFILPKDEFLMLIEGMEADARGPIQAPSMEELLSYCRKVAGAVGMLSIRIFGARVDEAATKFAVSLGDALQLTNILRDVTEDEEMDRLYLPKELLDLHGIGSYDPQAVLSDPKLGAVCSDVAGVARERFGEARLALELLDWRVMRPALLMMGVYEYTLDRLEERGWDQVHVPLNISKWEKAVTALRWAFRPPL